MNMGMDRSRRTLQYLHTLGFGTDPTIAFNCPRVIESSPACSEFDTLLSCRDPLMYEGSCGNAIAR